jgi:DNA-binding NarL/FixJ family response regulator
MAEIEGLTERELQIVRLIAQSKSNQEIGEMLVVTKRTVETHISNILSKLGFTSRGQIAAWAIRRGLI